MQRHFLTASVLALGLLRAVAVTNTPFSIQQHEGISWLINPNGERLFSFGVCVVTQGASREDFNPTNPGYAAFQHYENSNHWAEATLKRLKSWNFGTIGAESDRAEWIISLNESTKPIRIRLGPGAPPICSESAARVVNLSGVYLNTRNIAAIDLPAKLFGKVRFKVGDMIELSSTLLTHCRSDHVEWKGKFTLRD